MSKITTSWFNPDRIRYVLAIIIFVLAFAPLIRPMGLPLKISRTTKLYYDTVEEYAPGSLVLFVWNQGTAQWGEMGPPGIAMLQQLFNLPGTRIIVFTTGVESPALFETNLWPNIDPNGKIYGTDWVNLGYLPGGETAVAALATDPHSALEVDYYNNPIDTLPLMSDFNSGADIDLIVANQVSTGELYMRQFQTKWGTPMVQANPSAVYTSAMVYMESGQLKGLLNSLRGGAELEALINKPGRGLSAMDAMSNLHLFVLFLVVLGNIKYFRERKSGGNLK